MKKVYSFFAALLAAVMMVSCTSQEAKNAEALLDALNASDNAKVTEVINVMKSSKALNAENAILVISAYVWQISTQADDVKAQAYADCKSFYETVKNLKDFDKLVAETKGNNPQDIVTTMNATFATYEANLEAAEAEADDEEEYDEDEDEEEEDEE